ncbi:hypothetical protein HCA58_11920 [Micromonospora sp. HNM0581]|uniref:hypothetical protein n=1 Tax=Micromonospora sp. HNM0581 TaxID=2716341 RepID=UPI00146F838E|nr:hypothetical protein [Micromonospora sp. HNM0581]NLU79070.1 hypothetical protein [Micromonospora sp. HNM0581]
MAHGEADQGCAQGEPCRPGPHEPPALAKHHRRPPGLVQPAEPAPGRVPERAEDEPTAGRQRGVEPPVPRQRSVEPPTAGPADAAADGCRSVLPGWAGAHRHGPVRPAHRSLRRDRPPGRWC